MISAKTISQLLELASISLPPESAADLPRQVSEILDYVAKVQSAPTADMSETHQVTNSHNVWREDSIDESRMLSPNQALAAAAQTYQNYFLVDAVIDHEAE